MDWEKKLCPFCKTYTLISEKNCQKCGAPLYGTDEYDTYAKSHTTEEQDSTKNYLVDVSEFEKAREILRKLLDYMPTVELKKFETDGGFLNLGEHKVTGREMNSFTINLQEVFNQNNKKLNIFCDMFREFFNMMNSINVKHLQNTLYSMDAANSALKEATYAQKNILETIKEIEWKLLSKCSNLEELTISSEYQLQGDILFIEKDGCLHSVEINYTINDELKTITYKTEANTVGYNYSEMSLVHNYLIGDGYSEV